MKLTENQIGALKAAAVDCNVPNVVFLYVNSLRELKAMGLVRHVTESGEGYQGSFYRITKAGKAFLATDA